MGQETLTQGMSNLKVDRIKAVMVELFNQEEPPSINFSFLIQNSIYCSPLTVRLQMREIFLGKEGGWNPHFLSIGQNRTECNRSKKFTLCKSQAPRQKLDSRDGICNQKGYGRVHEIYVRIYHFSIVGCGVVPFWVP